MNPSGTDAIDTLAGRLAEELNAAWRQGNPRSVEEFLAEYPELHSQPQAALRLVYEEFCVRQELGKEIPVEQFLARFPQWSAELRVLLDCHRLFDPAPARPVFPELGTVWGDFSILAELGWGSQGRVFLATQPTLGDRPVVLKFTPCRGREHLSLARLQHTGIVPLYFAQDDPASNLRTLCMPYFGGMTLAELLEALYGIPPAQRTGAHLLEALDQAQQAAPVKLPAKGPFRQALNKISYVETVCLIGISLAEALQYAHDRGLVHLDIKPSNVLLAADGQPMLLDFHLAQAPILTQNPPTEWMGGTVAYMPGEQLAVMEALRAGQPISTVVDGRADIYSLGVLLYEALGGSIPILPGTPPLHRCNPQVSVGLSEIIARGLAPQPSDRYQSASTLAADLRRHLNHQKLRGVRNRSWRERWRKWRRRSPNGLLLSTFALVVFVALGTAWYFADRYDKRQQQEEEHRLQRAQSALFEGQNRVEQHFYRLAEQTFQRGLNLVHDNPEAQSLRNRLQAKLVKARQLLSSRELQKRAADIHKAVAAVRYISSGEVLPDRRLRQLEADCAGPWRKRREILKRARAELPKQDQRRLWADLLDVAIILADLKERLAPRDDPGAARLHALEILVEAEKLFGPSAALEHERLVRELGDRDRAFKAARLRPQTAWEHCLLARSLMAARKWSEANNLLKKALDLEPGAFWPNYYQGVCAYQWKHYLDAVNAFRVCIALKPTSAVCFFNRGQAYAALKETAAALGNYRHAVQESMDTNGLDSARVYYRMALAHDQLRDRPAAWRCLKKALRHDPKHKGARNLKRRLGPYAD
jgi:serine/threonine protein kinase